MSTSLAPAAVRNRRERLLQTLCFEAMGLALVTPLYAFFTGSEAGESLALLALLSVIVTAWSGLYCTMFDRIEARCSRRVASERPHRLRLVHALGQEAGAVLATWPAIVAVTRFGWFEALLAELGLTAAYVAYGYLFHWGFDRLRPVR